MTCEWQKDVSAFYDGELPPERSAELLKHLERCEECSDFLRCIKSLERFKERAPSDEVSEEAWNSCWQKIKKETTRRILKKRKLRLIKAASLLGTAVATLLIALLLWLPSGGELPKEPSFADTTPLEIIDYSSEYTLMLMETDDATVIIMMDDSGD